MSIPSNQAPSLPFVHVPIAEGRANLVEAYRAWQDMIAAMAATQQTGLHHRIEALARTQHQAAAPDPPVG